MFIHTRVKKHGCENCGKYFALKKDLTEHMLIHTGPKEYIPDKKRNAYGSETHLREVPFYARRVL